MVDESSELPEGQFRVERLIAKRIKVQLYQSIAYIATGACAYS